MYVCMYLLQRAFHCLFAVACIYFEDFCAFRMYYFALRIRFSRNRIIYNVLLLLSASVAAALELIMITYDLWCCKNVFLSRDRSTG